MKKCSLNFLFCLVTTMVIFISPPSIGFTTKPSSFHSTTTTLFSPDPRGGSSRCRNYHRRMPMSQLFAAKKTNENNNNNNNNKKSAMMLGYASDWLYGANQIHQHYLAIWKRIMTPLLRIYLPLVVFFTFGSVVFPVLTLRLSSIMELLLWNMSRASLYLVYSPLIFYRVVVRGESFPAFRNSGYYSRMSIATGDSFVWMAFLIPIIEECFFRGLFKYVWDRVVVSNNNNNQEGSNNGGDGKQHKQWFGHTPWMVASSVLFALSHCCNALPSPPWDDVDSIELINIVKESVGNEDFEACSSWIIPLCQAFGRFFAKSLPVCFAVFQCLVTGILSLFYLCPLYHSKGLMASIGAHTTWNIFSGGFQVQILYRLLYRQLKKKRKQP